MKWILRLGWLFLGQHLQNRAVDHAKRQGVKAYLQVLQASRRMLVLTLAGFIVLQTMILAGFGALVTGMLLWDHDLQGKLQILFGVFMGMTVLPFLALLILASERVWYKASGAEKMVNGLSREDVA